MRSTRLWPITMVAGLLFAIDLPAQVTVHDIALTNPTGIQVSVFINGSVTNVAGGTAAYQVDPENNPDYWLLNTNASFGSFRSGSFSMTLDPDGGASFELQIGNFGSDVVLNSSSFLVVVSGLQPADPDYQLSGVEFNSSGLYGSAEFDLEEFPELDGHYGSFTLVNAYTLGVLAIEIPIFTNFTFFAGTNIILTGTFDAIDTSAVPEPAVAALVLALGAAGLVTWRRRSGRAA